QGAWQSVPSPSRRNCSLGISRVLCNQVARSHQPKNLRMNPTQREGCTSQLLQQAQTISYQLTSALSLRLRGSGVQAMFPAGAPQMKRMGCLALYRDPSSRRAKYSDQTE